MKKVISILLVVLVAFSALTMVSFAADQVSKPGKCTCDNHVSSPEGTCHCCLYCPNIDKQYLTNCAKGPDGKYDGDVCCVECTGTFPCFCGCSCCKNEEEEPSNNPVIGWWDDIWDQDAQDQFVSGFQTILGRISAVFDSIFNAIFEFLKIDGVLGKK